MFDDPCQFSCEVLGSVSSVGVNEELLFCLYLF